MDAQKWFTIAIIYALSASAAGHSCDFALGYEKITEGRMIICSVHSYRDTPANLICPKKIGDVPYSFYPKNPNESVLIEASQYPSVYSLSNNIYQVPSRSAYGTVSEDLFSIVDDKKNERFLLSYPSDGLMFVREDSNIYLLCVPESADMDMIGGFISDYSETGLFGPNRYYGYKEIPNGLGKPGIGVVHITLCGIHATHGCGSINTKLFLNQPEYDQNKKIYSCEIDVMKTPNIAFYCDGEIHPEGCFENIINPVDGTEFNFRPRQFVFQSSGRPITYAAYDRGSLDEPFSGICTCTNRETGVISAQIRVFRTRRFVCDIASKLAANRVKPILGKWCDVLLHPKDELSIIFPPLNGYYCRHRRKFFNFDKNDSAYVSAFTPSSGKTLYLGVSDPSTTNPLISTEKISDMIGGNALEIDTSSRIHGNVSIRYKENKPLALIRRWNMYFRWDLRCKSSFMPDITALIKVGVVPSHKYMAGCEYEPSGIFDEKNVPLTCNNIFNDCIGERLRHCSYSDYTSSTSGEMGGIYCPPGQVLMPPNCGRKCYTRAGRGVLGTVDIVRILDKQKITGLRVLGFENTETQSLSVSCSCVNAAGLETARLTINKLQRSEISPPAYTDRINYNLRENIKISASGVGREKMEILSVPVTRPFKGVQMDLLVGNQYWLVCPKGLILAENEKGGIRRPMPRDIRKHGIYSPSYVEATLWKKFIPHRSFFPLNLNAYFYEARYGMTGRLQELVATRLDSAIGTNVEGLKIHAQSFNAGGPDFSVLIFSYPESAIVVIKDPLKTQLTLSYLCGSLLPQNKQTGSSNHFANISIDDEQSEESEESSEGEPEVIYATELHAIEIPMVNILPTDPYLYGCGVLESKEEIFRPDTLPLAEKGLISGCSIDLEKSKKAGFYCPNPYKMIPENCFHNVIVSKINKPAPLMVVSNRLRARESRHFVIIEAISPRNIPEEAPSIEGVTAIECRCVTFSGLVVSKIRVENY